jgi:GT2 family glycosyltransferase/tetratricopeptide (TPR) repeat protein
MKKAKKASQPPAPLLGVLYCVHDDWWFLRESIRSFRSAGPVVVFVSTLGWDRKSGNWQKCALIAQEEGAEVVIGDWSNEQDHRRHAQSDLRNDRRWGKILIPDGDEIATPQLLKALISIAKEDLADIVHVHMDTYWKSPSFVIRPRENLTPALMLDLTCVEHVWIRNYKGGRELTLAPEYGVLHHLSYAGPDERIRRKIETTSHRSEWIDQWYSKIWRGFDEDRLLRNLHPTHPAAYGRAERIYLPGPLAGCWNEYPLAEDPKVPDRWPSLSIIISLYGGRERILRCLDSLVACAELIHEVIIVDDCSPDDSAGAVTKYIEQLVAGGPGLKIRLICNEQNLGFAGANNVGYDASSGDVILFLNSDTVVPRAGLIRLIESLLSSGSIGAVGPFTNTAGYHQGIEPTYSDLSTLGLFAMEFAARDLPDQEVSMLVGFCFAAKRHVIEEVGGAFDERFKRAYYEDNDVCMRIAMAGYKLKLATRAFVHHEAGSRSILSAGVYPEVLLAKNKAIFEAKWAEMLQTGYLSHLAGQKPDLITFSPDRHPEAIRKRLRKLAQKANISLTMIVKNEERCLGDCLRSTEGIFTQTVVVDTGSSDRTKEIAASFGAEVHEFNMEQGFAAARNESLKRATGDWCMFLDADDFLPLKTAEEFLTAVIEAPKAVDGFYIGVQFVIPGDQTRVAHLKLFRNYGDLKWEGRIHEQIITSLSRHNGIHRFLSEPVLHLNYDASPEGQAAKRDRNERLLLMDHEERPNQPFPMYNLGMSRYHERRYDEAIQWLQSSIEACNPGASILGKAYALLGASHHEKGNCEEALGVYRRGIAAIGPDPELQFRCGMVLLALNRPQEARNDFEKIGGLSRQYSSVDVAIFTGRKSHGIGLTCLAMDNYIESTYWLMRAMGEGHVPSGQPLFEAALARLDLKTAAQVIDKLADIQGLTEEWAVLTVRLAEVRGKDPVPFLTEICGAHVDKIGPRLVLARRLCQTGQTGEAKRHLEIISQMGYSEGGLLLSRIALQAGGYAAAKLHAEQAVQQNPNSEAVQEE